MSNGTRVMALCDIVRSMIYYCGLAPEAFARVCQVKDQRDLQLSESRMVSNMII